MNVSRLLLILGLVATTGLACAARAATTACMLPPDLAAAPFVPPRPDEIQSGVPIVSYLLAINWTPEWCRTDGQGSTAQHMECGHPHGFTLHGLWPNGVGKPYPRYCTPVGQLSLPTVRRMYCRTPSPELIQHEWQAHGGCGWSDPDKFFAQGAKLYDRIVMPKMESIPSRVLTAGALRQAFVSKNRWLRPAMMFVQTDREQHLTEVRICYDLKFQPVACPGGNGTQDREPLKLTPSLTRAF